MFPNTYNPPAERNQRLVLGPVTGHVSVEFGPPPFSVVLRENSVVGALVPEAAVDEDHQPGAGENDVGPSGQVASMQLVAQATGV